MSQLALFGLEVPWYDLLYTNKLRSSSFYLRADFYISWLIQGTDSLTVTPSQLNFLMLRGSIV